MSNCFSCGRTFKGSVNELLAIYKQEYLNTEKRLKIAKESKSADVKELEIKLKKVSRFFYKLEENGNILTCTKSSFKHVFDNKIKPNFKNGAEYAHIKEYNNKNI